MDSRYPVTCASINREDLLAVGDCSGCLRIYHIKSPSLIFLVSCINVATFFTQTLHTDEDQVKPGHIFFNKLLFTFNTIYHLFLGCDILSVKLMDSEANQGNYKAIRISRKERKKL